MKAVITTGYGSADVFKLDHVAQPEAKADEVLIKIHASSVTKADAMMRTGKPYIGRLMLGLTKPKHPIWGTGFAGVVEAVGSNVSQFNIGDKVFGENIHSFGTYAEYVTINENGVIAKMPENISFAEAAGMCDGGITSLNFLSEVGKVKKGDQVLINGASGALGTAAIQIAKYLGAEVTGVCSTKNILMVKDLGADHIIDYTQDDFTRNTASYDLIYDTVGTRSFAECRKSLKKKGIYASPVLGMPLLGKMILTSIYGSKKAKFSATGALPEKELKRLLEVLIEMIESGKLKGVIDRSYALEELADAHVYIETGRKKGNVVLKPV